MTLSKSPFVLSLFFSLSLSLVACGGGGSSNNTGTVSNEVSEARFNEVLFQSGAIVLRYSVDIDLQESLPNPNQNIIAALSEQSESTVAVNINAISDTEISVCGTQSTIETDEFTFADSDDFFDFFSVFYSSELPTAFCDDFNVRYFASDNSSASAQFFCEGNQVATISYSKMSDLPNTSFGSFSLNSSELTNVSSNNVQCGSLSYSDSSLSYSSQPNPLELLDENDTTDIISAELPYGNQGDFLEFFIYSSEPLDIGTYTIDDSNIGVFLTSNEFIEIDGEFNELYAESGTLTISSISFDNVTGTYDLVTENDIAVSGSFSIDLN